MRKVALGLLAATGVAFEPPPNEWTPVVGSKSQEVSDGRTSTTVVHAGVQAAGC
jgi:hypothetical protein